LYNFPADYTNKDGSKFWSGSKRAPDAITYNPEDDLQRLFVQTYAVLIARALGIPEEKDFDLIKSISGKVNVPEFQARKIKIKINDADQDDTGDIGADEENALSKLIQELSIYDSTKCDPNIFAPHDFEKDDDTNYHIDFIHTASNLRARNYRIKECDRQKTKMIAGKIIPAIATTTAAVTGLVALQIYTMLQTDKIDFMRGAYINLAVSLFVLTEPAPKIEIKDKEYDAMLLGPVKAIPPNWTVWDKIVVDGPMTLRQLFDDLKKRYNVEVNIITCNKTTLIQTFLPSNKDRLDKKIEDLYVSLSKFPLSTNATYLVLEVSADTEDGVTALIPLVQYNFK
jgi:ubiquitin-activating enzyme E1